MRLFRGCSVLINVIENSILWKQYKIVNASVHPAKKGIVRNAPAKTVPVRIANARRQDAKDRKCREFFAVVTTSNSR